MSKLKLMSFNIGGSDLEAVYPKKWEDRKECLNIVLKRYDPDVIGFQEAQQQNTLVLKFVLDKYDCFIGLKNVSNSRNRSFYNPIYWKSDTFAKIDSGSFYLSKNPNKYSKSWDAKDVRSVSWVKLLDIKSGNSFVYFNLHLDHRGKRSRVESSRMIIKIISKMQQKFDTPIFVAGDFNERAWQPINEEVRNYPPPILPEYVPQGNEVYMQFVRNGYKDTYIESGKINQLDANTYHDYFGLKFPKISLRIDWILTLNSTKVVKTKSFKIIQDSYSGQFASDHFPILAEIIII